MDNLMKVTKKLNTKELLELYKKINSSIKVKEATPLIGDVCEQHADLTQPIIKIIAEDGNWYRVYVSKESNNINWY